MKTSTWIGTTLLGVVLAAAGPALAGGIQLNEIRLDQPGGDLDEYLEIAGAPDTSLDGITLVIIGDATATGSGTVEEVIDLTGGTIGASGLFLVAEDDETFGVEADLITETNFENSDNVTYLLVEGFSGAEGDNLDVDDDGVLDTEPWTAVIDAVGLLEEPNPPTGTEFSYGEALGFEDVGPDGTFVPGHVYRCAGGGLWFIGEFDPFSEEAVDSPGDVNPACPNLVLSVAKSGPAVVISGSEAVYTLTIGNSGVDPADSVMILDTLPDGVTFVGEVSPDGVDIVDSSPPDLAWSTAAVGPGEMFTIEVTVGFPVDASGPLTNTVEVTTTSMGDDPADNSDSVVTVASPIVDPPAGLTINEIRIEQPGDENDEYFELRGDPMTSLDGLTYLVIGDEGSQGSGVIEAAIGLTGQSLSAGGLFLAAEETFTLIPGFLVDLFTVLEFEGFFRNVTHVLVANFDGSAGIDLDTDDDGTLDVTPWTDVIDAVGIVLEPNPPTNEGYAYGETLGFVDVGPDDPVGPDGPFTPAQVYRCTPDGIWRIGNFDPADGTDTPRQENLACPSVMLSVTKTGPETAMIGEMVTYTLTVINSGFDAADEVTITDTLPEGLSFVSETSPDEVSLDDSTEPDIVWSVASVDAKTMIEIQLVALVGETGGDEFVNSVEVTTTSGEDDPADNTDTALTTIVSAPADVRISEIRIDQPGGDADEYFELRGEAGASLDGLTYLSIGDGAGGSGVIESITSLTGLAMPANGLLVVAEDTFTLGVADLTANLNFENGDNVTHLVVSGFAGENAQDLDTDDDGTLDLMPWDSVVDAVGLIEEANPPMGTVYSYGTALGFEDVGPNCAFVPSHVYRCQPDDTWTIGLHDFDADDDGFVDPEATDTPGAANLECPLPETCPSDTDGNGFVDVDDLVGVILAWGGDGADTNTDINGDCVVNVDDLVGVILAWGPCP